MTLTWMQSDNKCFSNSMLSNSLELDILVILSSMGTQMSCPTRKPSALCQKESYWMSPPKVISHKTEAATLGGEGNCLRRESGAK